MKFMHAYKMAINAIPYWLGLTVKKKVYVNQEVILDLCRYHECQFIGCDLIFYGLGNGTTSFCAFDQCRFLVAGPAAAGVKFVRQMAEALSQVEKD